MKKVVIFFILILFSLSVYAANFDLTVSNDKRLVTIEWNNIFLEGDIPPTNVNLGEDSPDDGEVIPDDGGIEGLTTEAIFDNGFFPNVFLSIKNVFRGLFGLVPVGVFIEENYIISKYPDTPGQSVADGEIISEGLSNEFSCNEKCSYSYTETTSGTYSYELVAGDEISGRSSIITIYECYINRDCSDGYICENNECEEEIVIPTTRCEDDTDCEEGKECNEEDVCVDIILDGTCEVGFEETQECNFDFGICQVSGIKTRICSEEGTWGEFSECDLEEKCSEANNFCDFGCDVDTGLCMPEAYEETETVCDDELDTNCNGLTDCEDGDCSSFPDCIPDDDNNLDDECEESLDCEDNEICEEGECILDESYNLGNTNTEGNTDDTSSSRDITRRYEEDEYYEDQYPKRGGISFVTWLMIWVILLFVGVATIYFYLFKFKK